MEKPLRLLLVEDSESDARLLLRQLKHGGFDVTYQRVDTVQDMNAALSDQVWDVIVTDYEMPRFNGMAALRLAKARQGQIPCIMVSDQVEEDIAVAAMRAGARDYITKDNLGRLPAAVERELEEARERRLQPEPERPLAAGPGLDQVETYHAVFDDTPLGVGLVSLEGRWLFANRYLLGLLDLGLGELSELRFEDVSHPDDRDADVALLSQMVTGQVPASTVERRYVGPDGSSHEATVRLSIVRDAHAEPSSLLVIVEDVSERQRTDSALRESEQRYRRLVELSPAAMLVHSEGRIVYANPAAMKLIGVNRAADLVGRSLYDLVHPDSLRLVEDWVRQLYEDDAPDEVAEVKVLRPDGRIVELEVSSLPITYDGQAAAQAVLRDVTERQRVDQKRAVEYGVSRALADSRDVDVAVRRVVGAIGEGLDWKVGGFWSIDPEASTLVCTHFWQAPSVNASAFEAACRRASVARGNGVIGRVWQTGEPLWVADIVADANYRRFRSALTEGFRGAFAFPVRAGGTVVGVMDFFSYEVRPPEQDVLWTIATLSDQIGEFIVRKQAETLGQMTNGHRMGPLTEVHDAPWEPVVGHRDDFSSDAVLDTDNELASEL